MQQRIESESKKCCGSNCVVCVVMVLGVGVLSFSLRGCCRDIVILGSVVVVSEMDVLVEGEGTIGSKRADSSNNIAETKHRGTRTPKGMTISQSSTTGAMMRGGNLFSHLFFPCLFDFFFLRQAGEARGVYGRI